MRPGGFKVFGSKSSMFTGPSAPGVRALLTGPEADVQHREGALERYGGIIRGRGGEAVGAS